MRSDSSAPGEITKSPLRAAATLLSRASRLLAWLPTGNTLPQESWDRRHKGLLLLLWAHVLVFPWVGVATGHGVGHSLLETMIVVTFAIGAMLTGFSNNTRAVFCTIGLVSCSAILTHFSGGVIEMHFHFFVVVALVTLYQSWFPFGVAISYVVLHHGLAGVIDASSVYNHPDAIAHPWKWALVHGTFIAGESVALLLAWRLNEDALNSERKARFQLEKAHNDLAEAQKIAQIGSYEWDLDTDTMWWSDEMYRIFGMDMDNYVPTVTSIQSMVHPDDRFMFAKLVEEVHETGATMDTRYRIVREGGEVRYIRAVGSMASDPDRRHRRVGTCQDITAQKLLEDEIEHKAFHDPLTGLANRALFLDRVGHALARRSSGTTALLFVDLDDFKNTNDSLGHGAGDDLLIEVAARLQTLVRPSDTIARLGGDEFAILLEGADPVAAGAVAKRILAALAEPMSLQSKEMFVRASIGIAHAQPGSTSAGLVRDADIAMYAVKRDGKNGYRSITSEMRESVLDRLELKTELKRAIREHELVLHFQPIVSLDNESIVSMEALVRWHHPERGLVPPLEFIPLAEETGLILELGTWVLDEATRRAKAMQDDMGRRFSISVNLSPRQLEAPDIVEIVKDALDGSELDPRDLVLEITESVMIGNREANIAKLTEMREIGIQIAVDDFGTGYSSLSYLHSFPLDILKIERAFVAAATEGPEDAALAQAIIKLASILNLRTVAEGIETPEQLKKLKDMGCVTGQGYLFSPPLDSMDIQTWLTKALARGVTPGAMVGASARR